MREASDGWLVRDGVRLHFLEWAEPSGTAHDPAILLLHGLSSNARYWERVVSHLGGRRAVALDQRGHGLTGQPPQAPKVPEGFAMSELIEDVAGLIDHLELGRPVVVGHSWGATVALEVAGTRPELASGLVFVDGPVQSASNLFSWEEAQRIMQPPLPRFADLAGAIEESRHDFGEAWADDLEPFVKARIVPDGGDLILTLTGPARLELLRGLYESQPELLWPRIEVPAEALLALRSFARISRSTGDRVGLLGQLAPKVEVKWFDTPHDIPLYLPAEVATQIERVATLAGASRTSEPTA